MTPRRWTCADGLTLFARDYAAAEGEARLPVVCLHGLTRNSRDFEHLAPWLARGSGGCWRWTCAGGAVGARSSRTL
jgi:pimeloyl-ACP methyl ester carboxylesterase